MAAAMMPSRADGEARVDHEFDRIGAAAAGYRRLKRDIIQGEFAPGEKLLMNTLKARYGLGVGPLREALSQLVAERLVVAISQRGYRVAGMSREELEDVYDARAQLEAKVVQLAIERGDDEWESRVVAAAYSLGKVVETTSGTETLELWDTRHKAFHDAIAEGCGSPALLQARSFLADLAERYRFQWLRATVMSAQALELKREEHDALTSALLERDAERASGLIYTHLMTPVAIIADLLGLVPSISQSQVGRDGGARQRN